MLKEQRIDWDPATGVVNTPPQQVFLELTTRCNLACLHCSKDYGLPEAGNKQELDPAIIERLMPWLERARFVNLNVVGEPMLARSFGDVTRRLAQAGVDVSFNTNGLLLSEKRAENLVRDGVQSVAVSFDGTSFNMPLRGVGWETVRDGLVNLDEAKRRLGSDLPHLALAYTLMRSNLSELVPLLDDVLPRVRLHAVHIQPLVVFYETLRGENIYEATAVDECVERARALCTSHGTELVLFRSQFSQDERSADLTEQIRELGPFSPELGCTDPFHEIKVRADGSLDACSFGRRVDVNLAERDLGEIWNGPWYRQLRLALAAGRYEGICAKCPCIHGGAMNQLTPLRPGVHHSKAARLSDVAGPSTARER
ncbi:MAG: radical SAM protein [Planctomycetota bacterium]